MRRCSTSAGERESHRYPDRNCKRGQSDHDPFPGQAPPHRFWLRRGAARRLFGSFLRRRLHREELQLFADDSVVSSENLTPPTVTESDRPLSRADNVGEQDGRQKPVGSSGPSAPRQRLHRLTASAVRPATPTPESSPTARATSRQTCGSTAQRLVRSRRHLLFRGERSKQCAGKLRLWSAQPSSLF